VYDFTTQQDGRTVRFAAGAEPDMARLLTEHGARSVVLLCQAHHRDGAERLAQALGARAAAVFDGVTHQVPEDVARAALRTVRDADADWVLAHGGGSSVGVAKAVALQADVRVAAVPTTYAGSEATDIYGLMRDGHKVTGRDDRVRPRLVVYDPELTRALPRDLSLRSLLNALAHSLEALYAVQATPQALKAAQDSLSPLVQGFAGLARDPHDLQARSHATYGAWLAGEALHGATMALHHKLAHVLGGSFGTPHAQTHATLLPYTFAFNSPAADRARQAAQQAWGTDQPAAHLHDLATQAGLSMSLADLGLSASDIDRAADLAAQGAYPNPRPLDRDAFHQVLTAALRGERPST